MDISLILHKSNSLRASGTIPFSKVKRENLKAAKKLEICIKLVKYKRDIRPLVVDEVK